MNAISKFIHKYDSLIWVKNFGLWFSVLALWITAMYIRYSNLEISIICTGMKWCKTDMVDWILIWLGMIGMKQSKTVIYYMVKPQLLPNLSIRPMSIYDVKVE